tara:strand:- start:734 stop:2614 length:1881 start_codon:yes stop_codon:yes gene_type:complete
VATAIDELIDYSLECLRFEKELTVSQWADAHRMLSSRASSEPGCWRTERTPYLRGIMDALSASDPIQRVVFMKGAQLGATEAGSNWLGYIISHAPGPLLAVQPTVELSKRLSKQRLQSMIDDTPCLSEKIASPRSRDSGNTLFSKEFPGGMMLLTGANSAVGLRSTPCRYIFLDEVDAFPTDVEGEGDPVTLAERRSTTFSRRKIFMASTPTIKDYSRIETEFLLSDQRYYHVPCPSCGAMDWLKWQQLKMEDEKPSTVKYECEHCHERFSESHKTELLSAGQWIPTAEGDGKTAGFHLSSLYSPLGWKSWEEVCEDFLRSKHDAPRLKTWVNTILGETWEEDYASKVSANALMERCEHYEPGVMPKDSLALTVGVDVQDNRLAISVFAWRGPSDCEEGWLLFHQEIYGDPGRPEIWKQLDEIILREWPHESGAKIRPDAIAIDSGGHFTSEVYQYARQRGRQGVIAIKGQSQRNKPAIGRPTKVDVNYKGRSLKKGAHVYPVGSDTIKNTLFSRLKHNEVGPGYLHFHMSTTEEYFEQLTAEKQVMRYNRGGFAHREWIKKPNARNESLDTLVYAYAALCSMYMRYDRRTVWDQFSKRILEGTNPKQKKPLKSKQPLNKGYINQW